MVNLKEEIRVYGKIIFKWILKTGIEAMDHRFIGLRAGVNSFY
jgi:hypothetical protein